MKKITLTLCLITKDGQILLGMKKRGFGAGMWNGFGGKVEEGETIEEATLREMKEEVGLTANTMKKVGVLEFSFENDDVVLEMHAFILSDFEGAPTETEEMTPQWFSFNDIPYADMWPGDDQWIPQVLTGKLVTGSLYFDRPSDADYKSKILKADIRVVSELL